MHFIYSLLSSSSYPLTYGVPEIPTGVLADLHLLNIDSALLTDMTLDGTTFSLQLKATTGGSVEILSATVTGPRPNTAYALYDATAVVRGHLVTGSQMSARVSAHGLAVPVDAGTILAPKNTSAQNILPAFGMPATEYQLRGEGGITVTLNPATNELVFGVDEDFFDITSFITENPSLQSDVDSGIYRLGEISGPRVGLEVDGTNVTVTQTDTAIRLVYSTDGESPWSGCDAVDVIGNALHCSTEDGSGYPYPLDNEICVDEAVKCKFPWEV